MYIYVHIKLRETMGSIYEINNNIENGTSQNRSIKLNYG